MTRRIYERFSRSFQNPTKLSIMLLLTQNKRMTVTQMSDYIHVTKASLYQSIAELVNDGFVSEPEVQVKKNYVEKYYRLNTLAFKAIDPFELQKRLNHGASPSEHKDLLEALFTSLSIYFRIYGNGIRNVSSGQLQQIAKELAEGNILLRVFDVADEDYQHELKAMQTFLKAREKATPNIESQRFENFGVAENRIYIIAVPKSLMRVTS